MPFYDGIPTECPVPSITIHSRTSIGVCSAILVGHQRHSLYEIGLNENTECALCACVNTRQTFRRVGQQKIWSSMLAYCYGLIYCYLLSENGTIWRRGTDSSQKIQIRMKPSWLNSAQHKLCTIIGEAAEESRHESHTPCINAFTRVVCNIAVCLM